MTSPHQIRDVVVVGSMNVDLTVHTARLPAPGETVIGRGLSRWPGGKGSNQAVAAALMGAPTHLLAAVGDDDEGLFLTRAAAEAGVQTGMISSEDGCATGTALITVDDEAENVIVVSPGSNAKLSPGFVGQKLSQLGQAAVLCLSLEVSVQTTLAAARAARSLGALTLLNLSPYTPEAKSVLPLVDVVVLNEGEALAAVGLLTPPAERPWQVVGALLGETGAKNAVVTLGAKGSVVLTKLQTWPIDPVYVEPTCVHPVDTTGCGDAFTGALAAEMAAGQDIVSAARLASNMAAYAATLHGAQKSYPTRQELEHWIKEREIEGSDIAIRASDFSRHNEANLPRRDSAT